MLFSQSEEVRFTNTSSSPTSKTEKNWIKHLERDSVQKWIFLKQVQDLRFVDGSLPQFVFVPASSLFHWQKRFLFFKLSFVYLFCINLLIYLFQDWFGSALFSHAGGWALLLLVLLSCFITGPLKDSFFVFVLWLKEQQKILINSNRRWWILRIPGGTETPCWVGLPLPHPFVAHSQQIDTSLCYIETYCACDYWIYT